MRKTGFWRADWFLGLIVSAVMLAMANADLVQSLERKAYDWGCSFPRDSRWNALPSLPSTMPRSPILGAGLGRAICMRK